MIAEGWYLMSTPELEQLLRAFRDGDAPPRDLRQMTVEEALEYRDAGNLPDEHGRSLRIVLRVESKDDLMRLESKRLEYEPDYLDAPEWRREGSRPVNVVPLRAPAVAGEARPWWEDPELAPLEEEWQRHGSIEGLAIPGEYRSFVFKTILALRRAGRPVTPDSIAAGTARWLTPSQAEEIRRALT